MEGFGRNKRPRDTDRDSYCSVTAEDPDADARQREVRENFDRELAKLESFLAEVDSPISCGGNTSVGGSVQQLRFTSRLPSSIFAGAKIENEQGGRIGVELVDASTGEVVKNGPTSCMTLNLVVLEGGVNNDDQESTFCLLKERDGKRPLLIGDRQVKLTEGVGQLGELSFTDNSSWTRSKTFRLGLRVAPDWNYGISIRAAKTEAFAVKDQRGEAYKKYYPPRSNDPVWRLEGIGKEGKFHRRLTEAGIHTVEAFQQLVVRDFERLKQILGGMGNKMWKKLLDHAKTCEPNEKKYIYSSKDGNGMDITFNNLAKVIGASYCGSYIPFENLSEENKLIVTTVAKTAYVNWESVIEKPPYSGSLYPITALQQFPNSNEDRIGSASIPIAAEEQTIAGRHGALPESNTWGTVDSFSCQSVEHRPLFYIPDSIWTTEHLFEELSSEKARMAWLKVKAVLRWGTFVRIRVAQKRAQLFALSQTPNIDGSPMG